MSREWVSLLLFLFPSFYLALWLSGLYGSMLERVERQIDIGIEPEIWGANNLSFVFHINLSCRSLSNSIDTLGSTARIDPWD